MGKRKRRSSGAKWEEPGASGVKWEESGASGIKWEEPGASGIKWEEPGASGVKWEESGTSGVKWEESGAGLKRSKRFIDGFEVSESNPRYNDNNGPPNDQGLFTGNKSALRAIEDEFKFIFSTMPKNTREFIGHQIDDMLMECTFRGIECFSEQFRLLQTAEYGNCFTLENEQFVSTVGGPNDGLTLMFFIEDNEYLSGITSSLGFQVHVHAPGSVPNPYEEGLSVSAGMETFVGLKQVNIVREKDPYGTCTDGDFITKLYNITYTQKTCQQFCVQSSIVTRCGCFDPEDEEIFKRLNETDTDISFCRSANETFCLVEILSEYNSGTLQCDCPSPCEETLYSKALSTRTWPTSEYATILVEYLCAHLNDTVCQEYASKSRSDLAASFLKIVVYFEDLNYENITEQPDYEPFQFVSDIGGTIGLWIGLSLISVFEVFQFFYELLHFFIYTKPKQDRKMKQKKKLRARKHGSRVAMKFIPGLSTDPSLQTASSKLAALRSLDQKYLPGDQSRSVSLPRTRSSRSSDGTEENRLIGISDIPGSDPRKVGFSDAVNHADVNWEINEKQSPIPERSIGNGLSLGAAVFYTGGKNRDRRNPHRDNTKDGTGKDYNDARNDIMYPGPKPEANNLSSDKEQYYEIPADVRQTGDRGGDYSRSAKNGRILFRGHHSGWPVNDRSFHGNHHHANHGNQQHANHSNHHQANHGYENPAFQGRMKDSSVLHLNNHMSMHDTSGTA
ncbi:amiloride-sensitive sodium channel subunit gamma-2 [Aplysia californica]|uniref:Amiloride-sensitive sodium channel subunit gamma-2 n=1 Tax=Aplysia californica TaxID=6500 RepID=A0ABM1W0Q4_APLCA|nr:amiloride-sensitive sodium channel subunit gamma-2 [Aplysia californica]